jgi:HAMP domain-containing protein
LALSIAKSTELILDLRQALDLTILAAKRKKPIFDPMAVRWIKAVDDKGRLKLAELNWLAQTFENLRRGDGNAAKQLERFLERGRR